MAMMKGEAAMQRVRQGAGAEDFPYGPSAPALPLLTQTPGGGQSHGTAPRWRSTKHCPHAMAQSSARLHPIRTGLRTHSRAIPQPCAPPLRPALPVHCWKELSAGMCAWVWLCLFPLCLSRNTLTPLKPEEKHKLWVSFPNSPLTHSPIIPALVTTAPAALNK